MNRNQQLTYEQEMLVKNNISLVKKVISDRFGFIYTLPKPDVEDYEQIGRLALCKAAKQYKEEKAKFSTFAYLIIRQDLVDAITKGCILSDKESSPNDLFYSADDEGVNPVDASDLFADSTIDFAASDSLDVKDAISSFFNDPSVTGPQKMAVRAFLLFVTKDCSASEAGLLAGANNKGTARNIVAKGRDILKNRKEFKRLWETANVQSLVS